MIYHLFCRALLQKRLIIFLSQYFALAEENYKYLLQKSPIKEMIYIIHDLTHFALMKEYIT